MLPRQANSHPILPDSLNTFLVSKHWNWTIHFRFSLSLWMWTRSIILSSKENIHSVIWQPLRIRKLIKIPNLNFEFVGVFNLKSILWEFVLIYIIYSCLKDKRPANLRLTFQISVVLTVDKRSEKNNTCDNNFQKVYHIPELLVLLPCTLATHI